MGVIADRFRKELNEMQVRHAQTDREVEALIAHTEQLIREIDEHVDEFD